MLDRLTGLNDIMVDRVTCVLWVVTLCVVGGAAPSDR